MENIHKQAEEILRDKNFGFEFTTDEEFMEKVFERLEREVPDIIAKGMEDIANQLLHEEMIKLGRDHPCRYYDKTPREEHCKDNYCLSCPNYEPVGWLLRKMRLFFLVESIVVIFFLMNAIHAYLVPEYLQACVFGLLWLTFISRGQVMYYNWRFMHKLYEKGAWLNVRIGQSVERYYGGPPNESE